MEQVPVASQRTRDLLLQEILSELSKLPEEQLPEAYRELRRIRGRAARPGTGPLNKSGAPQEG